MLGKWRKKEDIVYFDKIDSWVVFSIQKRAPQLGQKAAVGGFRLVPHPPQNLGPVVVVVGAGWVATALGAEAVPGPNSEE